MAITGPASYIPTINELLSHWAACNTALPPASPFLLHLPATNTMMPRSQFVALRDSLQVQQGVVQGCLTDQQVALGAINLQKANLLARPANLQALAA